MSTRKFLSTLIPALPMLLTALLVILVTVIFLTAMRSKAHAQFGGVEQPMFAIPSVSGPFAPDQIPNLVIWVNPKSNYVFTGMDWTGDVSSDNTSIRSISNYVNNGFNLSNTVSVAGTTWHGSHNGNTNPCIYINWNAGKPFRGGPQATNNASEQWTFAVVRPDLAGYEGVYHYFWCAEANLLSGFNNTSSGALVFQPATGTTVEPSGPGNAIWQLITWKQKTDDLIVRTNGVLRANYTSDWTFSGYSGFALLGSFDGTVYYRGDLAELLHYARSMDSNEVWQVETYLANKHPFSYHGP